MVIIGGAGQAIATAPEPTNSAPTVKDLATFPAVQAALLAGDAARLDDLLQRQPAAVRARDASGATPLHVAARLMNLKVTKVLLSRGADPNTKDRDGFTALHVVAYTGGEKNSSDVRAELTRLLIASGTDIKAKDAHGKTALHLAAMKGRMEMFAPLRAAVDAVDERGRTPLHDAANYAQLQAIKWLLDSGAALAAKDQEGNTPLHLTAGRFRIAASEQLLDSGADANTTNDNGQTPLHALALVDGDEPEIERQLPAVAELLLARGANVNARDAADHTPVQYATRKNHAELARTLRRHGATE
jgi:ankyrin repeat protein